MTSNHLSAEALGRLVGAAARAAVDARLGTNRPPVTKRMALPLMSLKFTSTGKRVVSGLASTSSLDLQGDVVDQFGGQWETPLPLLWSHDPKTPLGAVRSIVATGRGLEVEAELVQGIAKGEEIWTLIQAQAIDRFSIGFVGIEGTPIPTGTRWKKFRLIEISIVACPANPDAKFRPKSLAGSVRLRVPDGSIKLRSA